MPGGMHSGCQLLYTSQRGPARACGHALSRANPESEEPKISDYKIFVQLKILDLKRFTHSPAVGCRPLGGPTGGARPEMTSLSRRGSSQRAFSAASRRARAAVASGAAPSALPTADHQQRA